MTRATAVPETVTIHVPFRIVKRGGRKEMQRPSGIQARGRPVVRFMVKLTDPKLGETILDPACGTGGFLTEAFLHLERQAEREIQYEIVRRPRKTLEIAGEPAATTSIRS